MSELFSALVRAGTRVIFITAIFLFSSGCGTLSQLTESLSAQRHAEGDQLTEAQQADHTAAIPEHELASEDKRYQPKRGLKRTTPLHRAFGVKSFQVSRANNYLIHSDTLLLLSVTDKKVASRFQRVLAEQFSQVELLNSANRAVLKSGFILAAVEGTGPERLVIRISDIGTGKAFDRITVEFDRSSEGEVMRTPEALESALREVTTILASNA